MIQALRWIKGFGVWLNNRAWFMCWWVGGRLLLNLSINQAWLSICAQPLLPWKVSGADACILVSSDRKQLDISIQVEMQMQRWIIFESSNALGAPSFWREDVSWALEYDLNYRCELRTWEERQRETCFEEGTCGHILFSQDTNHTHAHTHTGRSSWWLHLCVSLRSLNSVMGHFHWFTCLYHCAYKTWAVNHWRASN